ncbi:esterase/lipase family protein [Promicromonospora sp. CA-289599]|uniref:esterase/lipase family protein n=1 Tax=Promicromonospora sp. CA-289599 TaxID=3240014 RepID=UPI003D928F18
MVALNVFGSTTATAAPRACQKADARQAIVLVHGYNSGPSTWSADSLAYLTADNGRYCYSLFDYSTESTYWVDDGAVGTDRISRRLAEHIKELAGISRAAGGSGKAIVVAHSMGGLATRCALDAACSGVKGVANQVAGVVTIGTPHQGSFLRAPLKTEAMQTAAAIIVASCIRREVSCNYARAIATSDAARAFAPGSDELTSLPEFPQTVPVFAIAGSVKLQSKIFYKALTIEVGDLIVGTSSATARSQKVDGIGGTAVHDCGTLVYTSLIDNSNVTSTLTDTSDRLCWHSDLTSDRAVLADTLHVITALTDQLDASRIPADFLNTTYPAGICRNVAPQRVVDGQARGVTEGDPEGTLGILGVEPVRGQIDGDGQEDAAVLVRCQGELVYPYNQIWVWRTSGGAPIQLPAIASTERGPFYEVVELDDETVTVRQGATVFGDPNCCTSAVARVTWSVTGNAASGPVTVVAEAGDYNPAKGFAAAFAYGWDISEVATPEVRAQAEASPYFGAAQADREPEWVSDPQGDECFVGDVVLTCEVVLLLGGDQVTLTMSGVLPASQTGMDSPEYIDAYYNGLDPEAPWRATTLTISPS